MSEKTVPLSEVPVGHGVQYGDKRGIKITDTRPEFAHSVVVLGADWTSALWEMDVEVTDLGPARIGPSPADDLVEEFGGDVSSLGELLSCVREYIRYIDGGYPELAERAIGYLAAFPRSVLGVRQKPDPPPVEEGTREPSEADRLVAAYAESTEKLRQLLNTLATWAYSPGDVTTDRLYCMARETFPPSPRESEESRTDAGGRGGHRRDGALRSRTQTLPRGAEGMNSPRAREPADGDRVYVKQPPTIATVEKWNHTVGSNGVPFAFVRMSPEHACIVPHADLELCPEEPKGDDWSASKK